jgi:Flp pilus assembly protein TadD
VYALAYAGLADCFSFIYMYADSAVSVRLQAETNSRLALQMAPDLAQAHASRGLALSHSARQQEAEEAFNRAVELDPNLFDAYYFHGRHAFTKGDLESAAELSRKKRAQRHGRDRLDEERQRPRQRARSPAIPGAISQPWVGVGSQSLLI